MRCGRQITTAGGRTTVFTRRVVSVETDYRRIQAGAPPFSCEGPAREVSLHKCNRGADHPGRCGYIGEA